MPWLTAQQRQQQTIAAGHFGRCGKMVIKPYSIPEELRQKILSTFLKYVTISICGCWEWKGRIYNGYPCCETPEGTKWAHRVSYALFNGPIAPGMHIDHDCQNRICVRPDHLNQMTPIENYLMIQIRKLRKIKKAREAAGQKTILDWKP